MGFMEKVQARMELRRLEERYVKRSNRNVWRSDAQYVDGEYIYACREPVEPPPSRTSKSKPSSRGSSSSRSSKSKPSSRGSSSSRSSTRTTSSNGSNKSRSSTRWSLFH